MKLVLTIVISVVTAHIVQAACSSGGYYTYQNKCYPCSPGHYCPNGVDEFICPPGEVASG